MAVPAPLDARQRAKPSQEIAGERQALLARLVGDVRQRDLKRQHARRLEARIDGGGLGQAAQQQAGRGEQHDGERDLGDDEHRLRALTAAGTGALAAVVHRGAQVRPPRAQRRQQPDERPGDDGDRERDQQHLQVQPRRQRDGQRLGGEPAKEVQADVGDHDAGQARPSARASGSRSAPGGRAGRRWRRAPRARPAPAAAGSRGRAAGWRRWRRRSAAPATRRPAGSASARAPRR